ncbi:hypothetical protein LCGC14_1071160 [marine sediment metagenome]|uniref:Serine hydrolase family protein n=1 Tax=marine sediment metagenome TaxID=412755 RepID=A0A0F9N5D7_9ZZZZ
MNWYKKSKNSSIKFVLVHGWDGGPDKDWFPWLAKELGKKGFGVINMSMPSPSTPTKNQWVKHLQDHIEPLSNTIFVAHSLGCICVLRYLESIDKKIKFAIFVAPYIENEKQYKTVSSFFHGDINWKKIKNNCPNIYTICSDNDPFVSVSQCSEIEKRFGSGCKIVKGKGHFDSSDGVEKIPEIIDILQG